MAKKRLRSLRVVLKLPTKVADFLIRAQQIHDAMMANAIILPSPDPVLTKLQSDIDSLTTKEAAARSRSEGAIADRDVAKETLANDLFAERGYVEKVVNAHPENALSIAQDASMTLRRSPTQTKTDLAIKRAAVTGEVKVIAKAIKGAKVYEWQQSVADGTTWVDLPPTTKANTTVHNLTAGTTVWFRYRVITKEGRSNWTDAVSTMVL